MQFMVSCIPTDAFVFKNMTWHHQGYQMKCSKRLSNLINIYTSFHQQKPLQITHILTYFDSLFRLWERAVLHWLETRWIWLRHRQLKVIIVVSSTYPLLIRCRTSELPLCAGRCIWLQMLLQSLIMCNTWKRRKHNDIMHIFMTLK